MKKISDAEARKIHDFSQESSIELPAYVLEKDIHVCDAMKIIAAMPANKYFRLVFCGGTCLSKAYGILERMSEDVDFKVVPNDLARSLKRSALRTQLSDFGKSVAHALAQGGFTGEESVKRTSRDEGAYTAFNIEYESAFSKPESLRPHLLIEMNYTNLVKPTQAKEIGILLDRLTGGIYAKPIKLECVSLEEALAEKLISFPRRLGKQMADQLKNGDVTPKTYDDVFLKEELHWDKSLVRHLFDVSILLGRHPELLADLDEFGRLLSAVINKDAVDFKNKHVDYIADPAKELLSAMAFAKGSRTLRVQYDKFVLDMVYGNAKPSYDDAVGYFETTLNSILASPSLQQAMASRPVATRAKASAPSRGGPAP